MSIMNQQRLQSSHTCSTSYARGAAVRGTTSRGLLGNKLRCTHMAAASHLRLTPDVSRRLQQGCRAHASSDCSQPGAEPLPGRLGGEHAVGMSFAAVGSALLAAAPALAAEGGVRYDPGAGGDFVKNLAGVAYLGLVLFFIVRLLRKRARTATGEVQPVLHCSWLP